MTLNDSDRIEFLLTRYGQLNQQLNTLNQVVHRIFYLSLVFGVALLSLGFQADSSLQRGKLSILAAFIFLSLGLWTRTYLNGRKEAQRQRGEIINELADYEYDFRSLDGATDIFPKEGKRDWWEKEIRRLKIKEISPNITDRDLGKIKIKAILLHLYYSIIAILLFSQWLLVKFSS